MCVNTFAACIASKMIDYTFVILDYFARGLLLLSQAIFNKAVVNLTVLHILLLLLAYLCRSSPIINIGFNI